MMLCFLVGGNQRFRRTYILHPQTLTSRTEKTTVDIFTVAKVSEPFYQLCMIHNQISFLFLSLFLVLSSSAVLINSFILPTLQLNPLEIL